MDEQDYRYKSSRGLQRAALVMVVVVVDEGQGGLTNEPLWLVGECGVLNVDSELWTCDHVRAAAVSEIRNRTQIY